MAQDPRQNNGGGGGFDLGSLLPVIAGIGALRGQSGLATGMQQANEERQRQLEQQSLADYRDATLAQQAENIEISRLRESRLNRSQELSLAEQVQRMASQASTPEELNAMKVWLANFTGGEQGFYDTIFSPYYSAMPMKNARAMVDRITDGMTPEQIATVYADDNQTWRIDGKDYRFRELLGIAGYPSPAQVAAERDEYTLSPGQVRFRGDEEIASVPSGETDQQFTLGPGQRRFDSQGNVIASGGPSGNDQMVAAVNDPMVQAVLANPSLWFSNSLGQRIKERLVVPLQQLGFDFSGAETAALTPSMAAGISRLEASLGFLEQLDPFLTQREGLSGRVEGGGQRFSAWLTGGDEQASAFQGVANSILPALARSSGEVGNLADKEQTRYAGLQPNVSDPVNIRKAKYAAIRYLIEAARSGQTSDEMSPLLDYQQFAVPEDPNEPTIVDGRFEVTVE